MTGSKTCLGITAELGEQILHASRRRGDEMVDYVSRLVAIETPSLDPEAQGPAFDLLATSLDELGFNTRRVNGRQSGGQLLAAPRIRPRGLPVQTMIGHCDTVWPHGTLSEMPITARNGRLSGPGVFDMKAGLTQIIFALRLLREFELEPSVAPVVFVNSDEEIGSGESDDNIRRLAKASDRVLVLEPSLGIAGKLKTARKGVSGYTVTVYGRAAHAGLDPQGGVSAILELSHVIQRLFALNDFERGVTINVGTVDGGLRANVIAPTSKAVVDVRVPTTADAIDVDRAIRAIRPSQEGIRMEVVQDDARPPLERTPANRVLWRLAQEAAGVLGLQLDEGMAGGGSDGNHTSMYTATLDGLGAVGDGAHATHEYIEVDRMPERAALLALILMAGPVRRDAG